MKKPRKNWAQRRLQKKTMNSTVSYIHKMNDKMQATEGCEYLTGCGIIRDDVEHGEGKRYCTHADVRRDLGDEMAYVEQRGDICGFWTNEGRFVSRLEGSRIAVRAGQASQRCYDTNILSCDISWNARKAA